MRGYEIAPGIDGFRAAQNDYLMRQQAGLSQVSGLLGLQNNLLQMQQSQELAPLQRRLLEAQVEKNLRPASPFGKIDPKDYTAESLTKFANSGNYSDLVPVRKNEVVNLGGKSVVIDPYAIAPNTDLAHTATPHQTWQQTVQFPWTQQVDRANVANSAANVGIAGANLFYNTGMSPMGGGATLPRPMGTVPAPLPPSPLGPAPAGAPGPSAAPRPAPLGVVPPRSNTPAAPQAIVPTGATMPIVPGAPTALPPKLAQEVEAARQKAAGEFQAKRDFNMTGLNDTIAAAEKILTTGRPTESSIGAAQDWTAALFGATLPGAASADQLKAISGALVAKMPRMEGPQSDKDVQLYREMAAQVGDNTIPAQRRVAALQTVKQLWAKYERGAQKDSGQSNNDPLGIR